MGARPRHPHGGAASIDLSDEPRPLPQPDAELTLPLDADELRMLEVFHKSFKLPGLRLGLVKPVLDEDYYPPDEDFDEHPGADALPPPRTDSERRGVSTAAAPLPKRPAYEEPDMNGELTALLQQTRAMRVDADHVLTGEDAPTIDDEAIVDEPEPIMQAAAAHQRQIRRPGSSGSKPSSATGRARGRW